MAQKKCISQRKPCVQQKLNTKAKQGYNLQIVSLFQQPWNSYWALREKEQQQDAVLRCGEPGQGQQGNGLTDTSCTTWTRRAEQPGDCQPSWTAGKYTNTEAGARSSQAVLASGSVQISELWMQCAPERGQGQLLRLNAAPEHKGMASAKASHSSSSNSSLNPGCTAALLSALALSPSSQNSTKGLWHQLPPVHPFSSLIAARKWETTDLADLGTVQRVTFCPIEASIHTVVFPLETSHTYQIGCNTWWSLCVCITEHENIF